MSFKSKENIFQSRTTSQYYWLVGIHLFIGLLIYFIPYFVTLYAVATIFGGVYFVVKERNASNEALLVAAYFMGSEIILRMTQAIPIYEFSKYGVILILFLGIYYTGASKNALPYWIFLVLLIPGLVIATYTLEYGTNLRKTIAFNLSGPICLGVSAIYTYRRPIPSRDFQKVLLYAALPIIPAGVYLYLYIDNIRDVITGTSSNGETSGGFGPNQVSTILGLGMFLFFNRFLFHSKKFPMMALNLFLAAYLGYRGLITFSRGGMVTSIIILLLLIIVTYFKINKAGRSKSRYVFIFLIIAALGTWQFTNLQTGGLMEKRYKNQDAVGRVKESQTTGRGDIAEGEIEVFFQNPFFGVGVARMSELRRESSGTNLASHSEITRMLSEHGSLGLIDLLILIFTPLILYIDNKQNIYVLSFIVFWILTINHAAMRLAAPAFIYSLSLLKVYDDKTPIVHREQTI